MAKRTKYELFLSAKKRKYGAKFDPSHLDPRFIFAFNSGERIRILNRDGIAVTGTVAASEGCQPKFLLQRRARSKTSIYILGPNVSIVGVKGGRKYRLTVG